MWISSSLYIVGDFEFSFLDFFFYIIDILKYFLVLEIYFVYSLDYLGWELFIIIGRNKNF